MALDFTLLTEEQIWGDDDGNGQLDVIEKYGRAPLATDLALFLSGFNLDAGIPEEDKTGATWSATYSEEGSASCVSHLGDGLSGGVAIRHFSVRPILPPMEAAKLIPTNRQSDVNGIEIVEYGEYPQMLAEKSVSDRLEALYQSQSLSPTGKNYTFDSASLYDYDTSFKAINFSEYELDGKKYIRVAKENCHLTISTKAQPYWMEVQPIEWFVDPSGTWVSRKALFAGIQFDSREKHDGDFSKTSMKQYLDTYFAHEIGHEEIVAKQKEEEQKHDKILAGLSAQLEQATNGEAVKAIEERLKLAEKGKKVQTTPERLHEAAMIKRLKKARDILLKAHAEAQEQGDDELADSIVDMARPYSARYAVQQNKVRYRRAKRKQCERG